MKSAGMFSGLLTVMACSQHPTQPIPWEHGWKTDRVVATRYRNETMGYNIGFTFPKNQNDCDRAEIDDFMESHDGWAFESGGYPSAPMYVKFKDVKDKKSADRKLQDILPLLDQLMLDITNGVPIKKPAPRKIIDKNGKEWPECIPPDPSDPYGELNNNLNSNGVQYRCSALGKWEIDQRAMEEKRAMAEDKRKLYWALRTRVLTDKEMERVERLGLWLVIEEMVPYREEDKRRELDDALMQQFKLRSTRP